MTTHYLRSSETSAPEVTQPKNCWVIVINHHEARVFRSDAHGTVSEQVLPHAPDEHFRQGHHAKDFTIGREKPDPNSFFEQVAQFSKEAGKVVLFGSGTGTANEMDQYVAWLKIHHPEFAQRISGSLIVDEHHTTDAQLLAKARDFNLLPRMRSVTPPM